MSVLKQRRMLRIYRSPFLQLNLKEEATGNMGKNLTKSLKFELLENYLHTLTICAAISLSSTLQIY